MILKRGLQGRCPVCFRLIDLDEDGRLKDHHPGVSGHDWFVVFTDCAGFGMLPSARPFSEQLVLDEKTETVRFESLFHLDARAGEPAGPVDPSSQNRASRSASGRLLRAVRHVLRGLGVAQ